MEFAYSKHALEQMHIRGISKDTVSLIMANPLGIFHNGQEKVYHGITYTNNKRYLIRIFVNVSKQPPLIKTVYRTSKIDKYYEG